MSEPKNSLPSWDEINSLRERVNELESQAILDLKEAQVMSERIRELEAYSKRLREALEKIEDMFPHEVYKTACSVARKALSEEMR